MNHDPDNPQPESDPRSFIVDECGPELFVPDLRETYCHSKRVRVPGCGDHHATVDLSAYLIVHLIAALHGRKNTGDWHHQLPAMLREAHETIGSPKLVDNDDVEWSWHEGEWRRSFIVG